VVKEKNKNKVAKLFLLQSLFSKINFKAYFYFEGFRL